ncbi:putative ribosomal protein L24e/L24 superfamily [Helianthus debilis subsp. tardiflorus]
MQIQWPEDLPWCFFFANSKCKRYFHNKLKPSKLTWTAMYRKQHKKDLAQGAVKKRRRATKKPYNPYSRLLWELLWKLFRRREVRNLKSVMLLGRERWSCGSYNMFSSIYFSSPSFQNSSKGERDGPDSSMVPFIYLRAS